MKFTLLITLVMFAGQVFAWDAAKEFKTNCATCHSTGSDRVIGPGFEGLYGKQREFENADSVVAEADYIRESILNPNAKIVKGYPAKMNSFAGQLSEKEIDYIIEFIKTLK